MQLDMAEVFFLSEFPFKFPLDINTFFYSFPVNNLRFTDVYPGIIFSYERVYDYLDSKYVGSLGLGLYSNRVHIDTRSGNAARWAA